MPHPILSGFLQGFGDTIAANRKQSQEEADKAFQRDHDTLATLVEHSNDPEIQNRAMSGLVSMNQGKYQAGGLARFLGGKGLTGTSPDVQSLLDFVRSRGASPSAGAATGGAPPPVPGSAAQPAETVTERGGTAAPLPSPSPSAVGGGLEHPNDTGGPKAVGPMGPAAPSGGAAMAGAPPPALPSSVAPPGSSTAPAGGGGASPSSSRGTTIPETMAPTASNAKAVTQVKPTASAPPAGAPPPAMPAASMAGQPPPFNPQSGFGLMTPMQQDVWAAGGPARQQSAKYQEGHDQTMASLRISNPEMTPEAMEAEAHLQGMRWAGLPFAHLQQKVIDTVDEQGNPVKETSTFDPISGAKSIISRTPMAPQATNDFLNFVGAYLGSEFAPGTTPRMMAASATPEQRQRLETAWLQMQAQQAAAKAYGTQGQSLKVVTNPDGSTTYVPGDVFQGAPPPAPKMGGGAPGAPTAPTAAPVAPPAGPVTPPHAATTTTPPATAEGAPAGVHVGSQVGTGVAGTGGGSPPKPVVGGTPPPAAPPLHAETGLETTPPGGIGGNRPQASPSPALDPTQLQKHSALGSPYIDASAIGSGPQARFTRTAAQGAHIPVLAHEDVAILQSIKAARENNQAFLDQILPYLAADAASRPLTAFGNWLSELTQANPALSSLAGRWGTAVTDVKSSGVSRTNNAEINKGLAAMPEPGDTIDTALGKIQGMNDQFLHMENAILPLPEQIYTGILNGTLRPDPQKQPNGLTVTIKSTGQQWHIDADGTPHRLK
jgi:hypothetical protein